MQRTKWDQRTHHSHQVCHAGADVGGKQSCGKRKEHYLVDVVFTSILDCLHTLLGSTSQPSYNPSYKCEFRVRSYEFRSWPIPAELTGLVSVPCLLGCTTEATGPALSQGWVSMKKTAHIRHTPSAQRK